MRPVSSRVKSSLKKQKRMSQCALRSAQCFGRLLNPEWHHVWIYKGKQIDEPWAVVGVCSFHHRQVNIDREVKRELQRISLSIATEEDLEKYPDMGWDKIKEDLKK